MNGRTAKKIRREGKRKIKELTILEETNVKRFDKKLYRERRNKRLTGQIRYPIVFNRVQDDKGRIVHVPAGSKLPPKSNRFIAPNMKELGRQQLTKNRMIADSRKTQARTNARGD